MNTVTIGVSTPQEVSERLLRAWETGTPQEAHIGFPSLEDLWKTLTLKRWEILKAMTGAGPMAIREIARRVERDVKGVHGDVQALVNAGLLDKTAEGKIVFPYDEVRVDFVLKAA